MIRRRFLPTNCLSPSWIVSLVTLRGMYLSRAARKGLDQGVPKTTKETLEGSRVAACSGVTSATSWPKRLRK
ncbi:hypothetical protein D3C86_1429980 [compost metagenome]